MDSPSGDERLDHEVAYGKEQTDKTGGKMWYWETPAGQIRWKRRVIMLSSGIKKNMDVLEVGCGTGYFTQELVKTQANITATDISPDFLEIAKTKVKSPNVKFKIENAYNLTFPDNSFDIVLGSSVLHHLNIDQALQEFYRVLKPGGKIYFTEPNLLNPHVLMMMKVPFIRKLSCISPDETALIKWSLRKKLNDIGFKEITITSIDFLHPLTPKIITPLIEAIGSFLEHIPIIKEISGSMHFTAQKISK